MSDVRIRWWSTRTSIIGVRPLRRFGIHIRVCLVYLFRVASVIVASRDEHRGISRSIAWHRVLRGASRARSETGRQQRDRDLALCTTAILYVCVCVCVTDAGVAGGAWPLPGIFARRDSGVADRNRSRCLFSVLVLVIAVRTRFSLTIERVISHVCTSSDHRSSEKFVRGIPNIEVSGRKFCSR